MAGHYGGASKDLVRKQSNLMARFFNYKDYDGAVYGF